MNEQINVHLTYINTYILVCQVTFESVHSISLFSLKICTTMLFVYDAINVNTQEKIVGLLQIKNNPEEC